GLAGLVEGLSSFVPSCPDGVGSSGCRVPATHGRRRSQAPQGPGTGNSFHGKELFPTYPSLSVPLRRSRPRSPRLTTEGLRAGRARVASRPFDPCSTPDPFPNSFP